MRTKLIFSLLSFLLTQATIAQTLLPILVSPIDDIAMEIGDDPVEIDLRGRFLIDGTNGPYASIDTVFGIVDIEMLDEAAPQTVANFFNYVDDRDYDNIIIHRVPRNNFGVADFVVQGGGFSSAIPPAAIPADPPVVNEFNLTNARGTLAMAKLGGDPDSATNQWFFNLSNNASVLDDQNGGFTVFARVIGSSMNVVDAIALVPIFNATAIYGSAFAELPLRNFNNTALPTVENLVTINSVRRAELFSGTGVEASLLAATASSSNDDIATAKVVDGVLEIRAVGNVLGSADITVTVSDSGGSEASETFSVDVSGFSVLSHPLGRAVLPGQSLNLSVIAGPDPTSYQWRKDGVDLPGENAATLSLTNIQVGDAGAYTVVAGNGVDSAVSQPANVSVVNSFARLVNISTLAFAGLGEKAMFAGFVLEGVGQKDILVRAAGPELSNFGVQGVLPDPQFEIKFNDELVASNLDWGDSGDEAGLLATMQRVGAFPFSAGSLDAALEGSFLARPYSSVVSGNGNTTGTSLVEVYDADLDIQGSAVRIVNISTRAELREEGDAIIAGFVIVGNGATNVLIRAVGPRLADFGVNGVLGDPVLEIRRNDVPILTNDDWGDNPSVGALPGISQAVGAFPLLEGSKDAVVFLTLEDGLYTASVSSATGATGIVLVEVYEVK